MAELVAAAVPELLRPEQAAQKYVRPSHRSRGVRRGHGGPDVLHLLWTQSTRIRTRALCVGARAAWGRVRARVVLGAGEHRSRSSVASRTGGSGGTRAVCASNSTTASWRARSGGRAGGSTWAGRNESKNRAHGNVTELGLGLSAARREEDALTVERPSWLCQGACAYRKAFHPRAGHATILRTRIKSSGGLKWSCPAMKRYTLGRLRLDGDENEKTLRASRTMRPAPS